MAWATAALMVSVSLGDIRVSAQTAMPGAREMSGVPLPVADVPAGSVVIRVIRGSFDNNIQGATVEFTIDGASRTLTTDAEGRVQVDGLPEGSRVRAVTVVDGETLETQEVVVGSSGVRIMLVATDPEAAARAAEDDRLAAEPAVRGLVVLGQESRVVAEMSDDALFIFYILDVYNAGRVPVDIGGALIFDLPREARGTAVLQGSSPQATANGARITVTGPFAPGITPVQAVYEMPYGAGTVRIEQVWPAVLQQTTVLVQQIGGLTLESAQLDSIQQIDDRGQPLLLGTGGAIPAGQALTFEVSGLPFHPRWPRNLALVLAGCIMAMGIWAAFFTGDRRKVR